MPTAATSRTATAQESKGNPLGDFGAFFGNIASSSSFIVETLVPYVQNIAKTSVQIAQGQQVPKGIVAESVDWANADIGLVGLALSLPALSSDVAEFKQANNRWDQFQAGMSLAGDAAPFVFTGAGAAAGTVVQGAIGGLLGAGVGGLVGGVEGIAKGVYDVTVNGASLAAGVADFDNAVSANVNVYGSAGAAIGGITGFWEGSIAGCTMGTAVSLNLFLGKEVLKGANYLAGAIGGQGQPNPTPPPTDAPVAGTPVVNAADSTTGVVTGTAVFTDPNGAALTYSVTTKPTQGAVAINATTGDFTFTPKSDATGTKDQFVVTADNGQRGLAPM
ncbi:Ig-like domain-containing protein [Mycolicibacterium aromaticivorans]|nr:Ig-like domain-containing protein [Mycolicibacterium aromaticivorans]